MPVGRVGRERVEGQGYRKGAIMSRAEYEFVPGTLGLGGEGRGRSCGAGRGVLKVGSPLLLQLQVCTHHGHWPQLFVHHVVPPQPLPEMVLPGTGPPHLRRLGSSLGRWGALGKPPPRQSSDLVGAHSDSCKEVWDPSTPSSQPKRRAWSSQSPHQHSPPASWLRGGTEKPPF